MYSYIHLPKLQSECLTLGGPNHSDVLYYLIFMYKTNYCKHKHIRVLC